jgi:hypothetical protein
MNFLLNKKPATVLHLFEEFKAEVEFHWSDKRYRIKTVRMDGGAEDQSLLRTSDESRRLLSITFMDKVRMPPSPLTTLPNLMELLAS